MCAAGIAYTHQCSLCPAGTFSERGARQCSPCAAGYFSTKGSSECSKCAFSQYSGPKAAKCLEKPACTNDDYYAVSEPCIHGVTRTVYRKVKPTICRDDLPGAVRLPRAGPQHKCPPCNPGMSLGSSGKCEFCPKRHFSDGSECKRCPMNSIPNYGFQYVLWHNLPANMESRCEYIMEDSSSPCDIGESWLPSGDAVHTSPSYERGIALELVLSVHEGFSNPLSSSETRPSVQNPIAHITFVFETECFDASCVLYFVEDSPNQSFYRLIADFSGTQQRRAYSHPIISPLPTTFIFAFMRSGSSSLDDHITDRASIFSINVTNVAKEGGGASACLQCSSFDGECVPCSHGEYITEDGNRCQICPETTMLNTSSDRIGIKSCIQCGPNLHSSDGTECSSDGKLSINVGNNQTRKFDLSPLLSRTFIANGVRVFAREGSSYFHVFNISLFNANAICKESVGSVDFGLHGSIAIEPQEKVETSICRLTALPVHQIQNSSHHIVYVSPLSLGGQLIAITSERNFKTVSLSDKDLEYEGLTNDTQPLDIHLYYSSSSAPTDICTQGFHSVVTLRCDQNAINVSEARLPHGCPDGTCDGCLYHIIIATSYACPLCTDDDFTVIKGECLNGIQTIHSIPARHCVMSGITNKETLAPCTSMSLSVEILITTMVLMAIALCITVVLVCQRNKRLEYKYMKLVESQVGADGIEIIGTESCGLDHDEDEEEEEKVIFAKGKNRSFGGLNKSRRQPISEFRGSFANSERSAFVALEETD
ncbi:hypothetical protein AB6A40_004200 [Gnathostoma spinigerum]|uniref:MRH domain-containing protein n=1 Tax=Gnathostoma spinigerum TaxID=75299 RepID=A0ABD6EE41_9BILA